MWEQVRREALTEYVKKLEPGAENDVEDEVVEV